MKKVKCKNGHFFDEEKQSTCPLCGETSQETVEIKPSRDNFSTQSQSNFHENIIDDDSDKTVSIFDIKTEQLDFDDYNFVQEKAKVNEPKISEFKMEIDDINATVKLNEDDREYIEKRLKFAAEQKSSDDKEKTKYESLPQFGKHEEVNKAFSSFNQKNVATKEETVSSHVVKSVSGYSQVSPFPKTSIKDEQAKKEAAATMNLASFTAQKASTEAPSSANANISLREQLLKKLNDSKEKEAATKINSDSIPIPAPATKEVLQEKTSNYVPITSVANENEQKTSSSLERKPMKTISEQFSKEKEEKVAELGKTVSYYDFDEISPVVGFLIGVNGVYKGQDFRLVTGRNLIGRNSDMDIVLADDSSVSRDFHAEVIFEPVQKQFLVAPGASHSLTYLNDKLVTAAQELNIYDIITVGQQKLMFFPLVSENFSWENF